MGDSLVFCLIKRTGGIYSEVELTEMIVDSCMASQDLRCYGEISSIHFDQLLTSKRVLPEHVECSEWALFVGFNPVLFGLTP